MICFETEEIRLRIHYVCTLCTYMNCFECAMFNFPNKTVAFFDGLNRLENETININ